MADFEKHYRVKELAELWSLSARTITRLFQDERGVVKMGEPKSRRKRPYFTLVIPETVAQRVHQRLRNK